ncbi:Uncharacterised protein [Mycobacteroides abscessus subsp. abscessus]|nr:Uncharacterised protein [Mycobacteroides abscessus subsp. abscessus]
MAPSAASPATTLDQANPSRSSDTGYLVVNQPTVRERSILRAPAPLSSPNSS